MSQLSPALQIQNILNLKERVGKEAKSIIIMVYCVLQPTSADGWINIRIK